MTKKQRIAELERRVAELEAQPHVHYMPYWSIIPPTYGTCTGCGEPFVYGHQCWWRLNQPIWTTGGTASPAFETISVTYGDALVTAISGGLN